MPIIENGSEQAGGADITSYNLEYNLGSGNTFYEFAGGDDKGENLDR